MQYHAAFPACSVVGTLQIQFQTEKVIFAGKLKCPKKGISYFHKEVAIAFNGCGPDMIQCLHELSLNNNKTWFAENQEHYASGLREPAEAFVMSVGPFLAKEYPSVLLDTRLPGKKIRVLPPVEPEWPHLPVRPRCRWPARPAFDAIPVREGYTQWHTSRRVNRDRAAGGSCIPQPGSWVLRGCGARSPALTVPGQRDYQGGRNFCLRTGQIGRAHV